MHRTLLSCCLGLLACCLGLLATPVSAEPLAFDQHAIAAPFAVQDVLAGNFAEAPSVLLLSGEGSGPEVAFYAFDAAGWKPAHRAALPEGTVLADVMAIAGNDRFVIFDGKHLAWLDPADWRFRPLEVVLESSLFRGRPRTVALVDVGRDVNGDGADDLVLADFDGIWIALQDHTGAFEAPIKLSVAPSMRVGNGVTFDVPAMYALDFDGDGRGDLAVRDDDRLLVFRNAIEKAQSIEVPGGLTDAGTERPGDSDAPTRTLRDLADHNGDGIADITISTTTGEGPMEAQTATHFHFGRRQGNVTVFDAEPTAILDTGSIGDIQMLDIDGDGREDVVALSGDFSVTKLAMALMTGSISLDVAIYPQIEGGFAAEPAASRKMKVGQDSPGPTFADLNGDGRLDMLQLVKDGLGIALGEPGTRLFAKRSVEMEFDSPFGEAKPTRIVAEDLDQDGMDDLLLHYGPTVGVLVLLSR